MKNIIRKNIQAFLARIAEEGNPLDGFTIEQVSDQEAVLTGIHSGKVIRLGVTDEGSVTVNCNGRSGKYPPTLAGIRGELAFQAFTGVKERMIRRAAGEFFADVVTDQPITCVASHEGAKRMIGATVPVGSKFLHLRTVTRSKTDIAFLACVTGTQDLPAGDMFQSIALLDIRESNWTKTAPGRLARVRAALT